jgi:hypothetical protein
VNTIGAYGPRIFTNTYSLKRSSSALGGLPLRFTEHTLLRANQLWRSPTSQKCNVDLALCASEVEVSHKLTKMALRGGNANRDFESQSNAILLRFVLTFSILCRNSANCQSKSDIPRRTPIDIPRRNAMRFVPRSKARERNSFHMMAPRN